jgi:Kef-type K+ transport system membrane component KefB
MSSLSPLEVTSGLLSLGTLLVAARVGAALAKRLNQPALLGEIASGVVLGPSILGALNPGLARLLVPEHGGAMMLETVTTLGVTLFMFVAGTEVDFSAVRRERRPALILSAAGFVMPFALGLAAARYLPWVFEGEPDGRSVIFAVFIATALSITALPVIAKTLMDLNVYRTRFGVLIIAAGFVIDTFAGLILVTILGMGDVVADVGGIARTIAAALVFMVGMCTVGRSVIHRALNSPRIRASDSTTVLGLALGYLLLAAAFTDWLGLHPVLGAFVAGVAIGDSTHLRERPRTTIREFVASFFAPIFFASIGLKVNIVTGFDWSLMLTMLSLACVGKILGVRLAARWIGMTGREAWAIGFGMNARGAMEIVFGLLGWQYGLISERMLVVLVLLAIITSMMSGPAMRWLLMSTGAAASGDSRFASDPVPLVQAVGAPIRVSAEGNDAPEDRIAREVARPSVP